MLTALVALAMLGYGLALHRRLAWPAEVIPFALAAFFIDVIYLAGLLGVLRPGAYAVVAIGLGLGGLSLKQLEWNPGRLRHVPPGIVVFAVLVLAVSWRLQGAAFVGWDEFSHWGLTSKAIIETNALITSESPVLFKDYPPGSALFHYLVTLGSGFSETGVYVAHAVLALAALTVLCTGSRWSAVLATLAFGYFGLFAFARGIQTLDVDHIVALFFGCGIGGYFLSTDSGRLARVIPVALALPLLKSVGLLLAIFMVFAVVTDQLLGGRPSRRQMVLILLLALAPFGASRTWSHHVKTLGARPTFSLQISTSSIRDSFSESRSSPRDRATIAAFREALGSTPLSPPPVGRLTDVALSRLGLGDWSGPGPSVVGWTLVFALFAAIIMAVQPDATAVIRSLSWIFWVAACGVCYAFGLLVLYLYSFSEYEGVRLASFGRYFGIFFLGVGFTVLAWALLGSRSTGWRGAVSKFLVAGLAAGMVYVAPNAALGFAWQGPQGLTPQRARMQEGLRPALAQAAQDDRIYLVWQGSNGFEFYAGRYEVAPRNTNLSCWSMGAARFEGDVWTCPLSPGEWAARLESFDFVVLGRVDPRFWDDFGELFKGSRNATVYKVEKSGPDARLHLSGVVEPPTPESRGRVTRDERRVADLHQIKAALDAYVSRVGPLPTPEQYGEASGPPNFWANWWDVSAHDGDGDGHPFLDFLIDGGILPAVPVDPVNEPAGRGDPRDGKQYVYFVVPPNYDYAGGACEPGPNRWNFLVGITKLESEVARPPSTFSGSGCACLWRDAPNFFQQHFDYVMCGTFRR